MWVREMWLRWLFVCIYIIWILPPSLFLPYVVSKQHFVLSYLFFLLQYCLPNQAYLFISVTKRTLLIICSTQELIDCFLPWNCPSHLIWIFSHVRIANHIFVEKATLVRFVRCLVERDLSSLAPNDICHTIIIRVGTATTRYMCMRMHLSLSFLLLCII